MAKRRVVKIHLVGGKYHRHIAKMIWYNPSSPDDRYESTRAQMVTFVRNNPGEAYVYDSPTKTRVIIKVVNANPPYVRTKKDGEWQDNLLHLPKY